MSSSDEGASSPTAAGAESPLLKLPEEVLAHISLDVAGADGDILDRNADVSWKEAVRSSSFYTSKVID